MASSAAASSSSLLSTSTLALAATSVGALCAVVYIVYQQRDTLFGNRGYDNFEKKYAAQLRASRRQQLRATGHGDGVGVDGSVAAGGDGASISTATAAGTAALIPSGSGDALCELEMSSFAAVKVLYGSDSGTAEAFAKGLVMTLKDRGVSAALIDPSRWAYLDRHVRQSRKTVPLFQFPKPPPQSAPSPDDNAGKGDMGETVSDCTGDAPPMQRRTRSTSPLPAETNSVCDTSTRSVGSTSRASAPATHRSSKAETSFRLEEVDEGARTAQEILLFVVSTAGDGEPTGNFLTLFQEMHAAVLKSQDSSPAQRTATSPSTSAMSSFTLQEDSSVVLERAQVALHGPVFSHVRYAVFALGDSSYKYYCRAGMTVNTLLKNGGGLELHRLGFGDARGGRQEDSFDDWQASVLAALVRDCGLVLSEGSLSPPKPQMHFVAIPHTPKAARSHDKRSDNGSSAADTHQEQQTGTEEKTWEPVKSEVSSLSLSVDVAHGGCTGPCPFPAPPPLLEPSQHRPTLLQLVRKEQLTPTRADDGSAVYRLTFSLAGTNVTYQAGDHLGLYPMNPAAEVDRCAILLGLSDEQLNTEFELQEARTRTVMRNTLPACVTLRTALSYYVDLCGKPKKSALCVLAKYCTDAAEKRAFLAAVDSLNSAAAAGMDTKEAPATQRRTSLRTVLDYMEAFSSCCGQVPVGHFLEITPRIQPRYYSIATDRATHPREVQILVRILADGLASRYLADDLVAVGVGGADEEGERTDAVGTTAKQEAASGLAAVASAAAVHCPLPLSATMHDRQRQWRDPSVAFAFVRVSTFHLPASLSPTAPILLIGPGTGAAAMVGLLYRREGLMRRQVAAQAAAPAPPSSSSYSVSAVGDATADTNGNRKSRRLGKESTAEDAEGLPALPASLQFGECLLFFGARHERSEFFIRDEVTRWALDPSEMAAYDAAHPETAVCAAYRHVRDRRPLPASVLTTLECAFSRDQPEKVYVTDLLRRHTDFIYDMIMNSKESMIFLSGDATSMAKDVDRVLVSIIQEKGKKGKLSALRVLQSMESEHRFLKDVY